jgi:hypothetical protein
MTSNAAFVLVEPDQAFRHVEGAAEEQKLVAGEVGIHLNAVAGRDLNRPAALDIRPPDVPPVDIAVVPTEINSLFGGVENVTFHLALPGREVPEVGAVGIHGIDVHPAFVFGIKQNPAGLRPDKRRDGRGLGETPIIRR